MTFESWKLDADQASAALPVDSWKVDADPITSSVVLRINILVSERTGVVDEVTVVLSPQQVTHIIEDLQRRGSSPRIG